MWANRITRYSEQNPEQLLAHYANTNNHTNEQREALKALLGDVGIVQNIIVNDTTGRLLDGHARVEEALTEGQTKLPVTHVELTEEEETKILLFLDPIARLAYPNKENIELLLETVTLDSEPLENLLEKNKKPKSKKVHVCPKCGYTDE
jgi:ParB-like chromosome segregation protein Spo0J